MSRRKKHNRLITVQHLKKDPFLARVSAGEFNEYASSAREVASLVSGLRDDGFTTRPRPWIYIAGPITKGDTHRHIYTAMAEWKWMQTKGLHAICPHWSGLQQMFSPESWEDWISYDLETIDECQGVFRLAGESRGADAECEYAASHSIPVFTDRAALVEYFYGKQPELSSVQSETGCYSM